MQPRKLRILSAIMAGSLTLAVVAITAPLHRHPFRPR
jgi:hypothetical protein